MIRVKNYLSDMDLSFIPPLRSPRQYTPPVLSREARDRYTQAHQLYQDRMYAAAVKQGGHIKTTIPDTSKSNGLQTFIINFMLWSGHNAVRTSTVGRKINKGGKDIWIPTSGRKGTADVSCTVYGRSVKLEVKVGKDTPSDDQLKEQAKERAAGGVYEFVHDVEEFLILYDELVIRFK